MGADLPSAEPVKVIRDQSYKGGELSPYEKERCRLDVYLPPGQAGFPTLVWFHGGGLKGGDKEGDKTFGESLARAGVALVSVEYRLSPAAKYPSYIEDAAAAVAWTREHIARLGGSPGKIFIGGHSAGGYLALMIGLDAHYLKRFDIELDQIAGLIPVSGQTMTHYTVREERGIGMFTVTADEAAPVHYGNRHTVPMLVLYADNDMAARAEENEYFVALMKGAGNTRVTGKLIQGHTHDTIATHLSLEEDPGRRALLDFIREHSVELARVAPPS